MSDSHPMRRPTITLRLFEEGISARLAIRPLLVGNLLLLTTLVIAFIDLSLGAYSTPLPQVLNALRGAADEKLAMVIFEWRMPRIAAALFFGAALGVSGAIFQSLTRNPLGSPDVIGIDAGAFTGVLVIIMFFGSAPWQFALGALCGSVAAAGTVFVISCGTTGLRFILTGVGIGIALTAINTWFLSTARLEAAMSAADWGAGALDGIEAGWLLPVAVALCALIVLALALQRAVSAMELGSDVALALGVPVDTIRLAMLLTGGALTTIVTASAGPIGFVALAAPQLARMLAGTPGLSLPLSAAMGAVLLTTADLVAANAFAPGRLPVGVVTFSGGGAYLLWLLAFRRHSRK